METFEPWAEGSTTDFEDEDVTLSRTGDGGAVILPRSLTKLGPDQRELASELMHIAAQLQTLQAELSTAVEASREDGLSWSAIGFSVGTTGEAARQRWGV